jgi:hypothetical protein
VEKWNPDIGRKFDRRWLWLGFWRISRFWVIFINSWQKRFHSKGIWGGTAEWNLITIKSNGSKSETKEYDPKWQKVFQIFSHQTEKSEAEKVMGIKRSFFQHVAP